VTWYVTFREGGAIDVTDEVTLCEMNRLRWKYPDRLGLKWVIPLELAGSLEEAREKARGLKRENRRQGVGVDGATPYGFCPACGAPGVNRERRPDGNDECHNGHTYPSRNALTEVTNAAGQTPAAHKDG
jgi:hypothetical protein